MQLLLLLNSFGMLSFGGDSSDCIAWKKLVGDQTKLISRLSLYLVFERKQYYKIPAILSSKNYVPETGEIIQGEFTRLVLVKNNICNIEPASRHFKEVNVLLEQELEGNTKNADCIHLLAKVKRAIQPGCFGLVC